MTLLDLIDRDILHFYLIEKLSLKDLIKFSDSSSPSSSSLSFLSSSTGNEKSFKTLNIDETIIKSKVFKIQNKDDHVLFVKNRNLMVHLTRLSIKHCNLTKDLLMHIISIPSNLTFLEFDHVDNLDDDIIKLACTRHSIKRLSINKCLSITNQSLQIISYHGNSIESLKISRTMITVSGLEYICHNKRIKRLDISESYLLEVDKTIMILQKFQNLKSLKLGNNEGYNYYLMSCLLSVLDNLIHLDVTNCIDFTIDEINELMKSRRGLYIKHNAKIKNQTFDAIAEYLRNLTRVH